MSDDVNERGFLGNDIIKYREYVISKHKKFFDFVEELNAYSQKKKFDLGADSENGQHVISLSLFAKIINDIQTVHILCSCGLTQQSRIILRSTLEGFFLLAKVGSDATFVVEYIQADLINRINIMKASRKYSGGPFADVKRIATDKAIDELEKQRRDENIHRIVIEDVANSVGLGAYYDSVYRLFSQDVHVQARSIEEYVATDKDGQIASFEWGPKDEDAPTCLAAASDVLLRSWMAINQLFGLGIEAQIQKYMQELERIQKDVV